MAVALWLLAALLIGCRPAVALTTETCDASQRAYTLAADASVYIGVILGLHGSSSGGPGRHGCGAALDGMQTYEALRWAVARINQDSGVINGRAIVDSYVPGVKIGLKIRDSCSMTESSTQALLDFLPNLQAKQQWCTEDDSKLFLGLMGDMSTDTTAALGQILNDNEVGQISFSSLSESFNDRRRYPFLMRTALSNAMEEASAIVGVLKSLNWTYVAVVYTDDVGGRDRFAQLLSAAYGSGVCVTMARTIATRGIDVPTVSAIVDAVVDANVMAVVLLAGEQASGEVLTAAAAVEQAGLLLWFAPFGIGSRDNVVSGRRYARGLLTMSPASRQVAEFEDHWVRLDATRPPADSPWYAEWYMTVHRCRLPGASDAAFGAFDACVMPTEAQRRREYKQTAAAEAAIMAVYAYAKALKLAQARLCGDTYRGLCGRLTDLSAKDFYETYVRSLDFTFTQDERVPTLASSNADASKAPRRVRFDDNGNIRDTAVYDIWNYNDLGGPYSFRKVGVHRTGNTTVDRRLVVFYNMFRTARLFDWPISTCRTSYCDRCIASNANAPPGLRFGYRRGTLLLAALVSVRSPGDGPFSCGPLTGGVNGGAQLVEAFELAVEDVARRRLLHDGVTLGSLVFDDCGSDALARNIQTNVATGAIRLTAPDGGGVDAAAVGAYVETSRAGLKAPGAAALAGHDAPVVGLWGRLDGGAAAAGVLRAVPDDGRHVTALVLALERLRWRYVQLVYTDDERGRHMAALLRNVTRRRGVCVAAEHRLSVATGSSYTTAVADIQRTPAASVVVVVADAAAYNRLMQAFRQHAARFTFVCSIDWDGAGRSLEGLAFSVTEGSLMVDTRVRPAPGFLEHLRALRPRANTTANPWFNDWYELSMNCYLDERRKGHYPAACGDAPISDAVNFRENTLASHIADAVQAIARGLHKTLQRFCGVKYSGVCYTYRSSPLREQMLYDYIREVRFEKDDGGTFEFVGSEANVPIEILNIQSGGFVKVGVYEPATEDFTMEPSVLLYKTGAWSAPACVGGGCPQCDYLYTTQDYVYAPGDVLLGGLFDVHAAGGSPLSCGPLGGGYPHVEAFMYAVEQVNGGTAAVRALPGVRLGGLALDTCGSAVRAADSVAGLAGGSLRLAGGLVVDEASLAAWVTLTSTAVAVEVGDVVRDLGTAQLVAGVTAAPLTDRRRFPTLFSVRASEARVADGLLRLARHMGWLYVSAVHSADARGRAAAAALADAAKRADVCVVNVYELDGTDSGAAARIVAKLQPSPTDVVVLLTTPWEMVAMLTAKQQAVPSATHLVYIAYDYLGRAADLASELRPAAAGTLLYQTNTPPVEHFDDYLSRRFPDGYAERSWFHRYYERLHGCSLRHSYADGTPPCANASSTALTDAPGYRQGSLALSVVHAVYASAHAVDAVLKDLCGAEYSGVCQRFRAAPDVRQRVVDRLKTVAFIEQGGTALRFVGGQYDQGHTVYRYTADGSVKKAATYVDESFTVIESELLKGYESTRSGCGNKCAQCQQGRAQEEKFVFTDGDFIIAGVFDVHHKGANPFTCGPLNDDQGFQLLAAFNYAVGVVNSGRGLFGGRLSGVRVGGLALDSCSSAARAGNLVANLHSGYLSLSGPAGRVDADKVDVYVGAFESEMSMKIADVLNVMDIAQISYGSTSMQLADRARYPNFLRSVPADDKHARAVIALLKRFDISYVQVVSSPGADDQQAAAEFVRLAAARDVCVAQSVAFEAADPAAAVARLVEKRAAGVVVVYLEAAHVEAFLRAVQRDAAARERRFRFVGSQKWAASVAMLSDDVGSVAVGSVTLGVETADLTDFDAYLADRRPAAGDANPWFDEYYQGLLRCSLPGRSAYRRPCDLAPSVDVPHAPGYAQDQYVLYTVNAVYSAALGLDIALRAACGESYNGSCDAFRTAPDRRRRLLDGIRQARFLDATRQIFEFSDDGESSRGYHIYTIARALNNQGYIYENVGSYNDRDLLTIDAQFSVNWRSACPDGVCEECPQIGRRRSKYMKQPATAAGGVNVVGFFAVHGGEADGLTCGPLDARYGFQHLLAFFYALDEVKAAGRQLPGVGVEVGGIAADTCGSPLRATLDVFSLLSAGRLQADEVPVDPASVLAVVAMGDGTSAAVVELLAPRRLTTVSPTARSDALDGTPYFLRTAASQAQQAAAMVAVAAAAKWNYVTVVGSEEAASESDADAFVAYSQNRTEAVCVAARYRLSAAAGLSEARALVRMMAANRGSNVLMLFLTPSHARLLLRALRDEAQRDPAALKARFVLVGSSAWPRDDAVTAGYEETAAGALSLRARSPVVDGFRAYVAGLTVARHGAVPDDWFEEFWQQTHECRLENATTVLRRYTRVCAVNEALTVDMVPDAGAIYTIIATQALVIAFNNTAGCRAGGVGPTACRAQFYEKLKAVRWSSWKVPTGGDNFVFHFENGQHGDLGFDILNYQKHSTGYAYKQIGSYDGRLDVDQSAYVLYDASGKARAAADVTSKCPFGSECRCVEGTGQGGWSGRDGGPTVGRQTAEDLNASFTTVWGIIVTALTVIGIVVTLLLFVYLLIFYPVRGGTTVLGYLLLFGVLLVYVLNFAFLVGATPHVCAVRRFSLGFVYALCFACLLLKVLNTWRVTSYYSPDDEDAARAYRRLAHPACLFLLAIGLTLVQVAIGVEWLVLQPAAVDGTQCAPADTHYDELVVSCVYVMALVALTLVFAGATWDSDENGAESRYVLATAAFTVGVWVAWTLVATLAGEAYREPAVIIANLVNATVILVLIFVRKLYLLSKYEKEMKDDKRSRLSSIRDDDRKDGEMFHNISYVDDTGTAMGSRAGSHLGGSAIYSYDPRVSGADAVY